MNHKTLKPEISLMISAAHAIERRCWKGPGFFRLGFMDGKIVCVREGQPAPAFFQIARYSNDALEKGFTARHWLILAVKISTVYKEKILCQKQPKSSALPNVKNLSLGSETANPDTSHSDS